MITVLYIWKYRRLLVKQYLTLGINSTTKLHPRELSWVDRLNRFRAMASADDVKQKEAEVDTLLSKPTTSAIMGDNVTEKESEVAVEDKSGKYPWTLLVRTVLLLNAFLALGINDAMGGPTLLDLR